MTYWKGNQYTVLSRDEMKQDIARRKFPDTEWVLGDVRDLDRLKWAVAQAKPDLVIHAAAVKYIPEAENNVDEAVKVNVDGSRNVIKACVEAGVPRVVGISTDKAVMPLNVYGMTKALMERLFIEANRYGSWYKTVFTLTRYGNVVGSTGSVIPMFIRQREEVGRLTVTDPTMTRYWQSVQFSVELIQLAADLRVPGGIVIPNGKSMNMGTLAAVLAQGCPVDVIGARRGEKQHESLVSPYETERLSPHYGDYILFPQGVTPLMRVECNGMDSLTAQAVPANVMQRMIDEAATI